MTGTRTFSPGLRFGIMCNGRTLETWKIQCIEKLCALDNVAPALVILNAEKAESSSPQSKSLLYKLRLNGLLFRVYQILFFRPESTRKMDMIDRLAGIPTIQCKVIRKGRFSQYFSDEDVSIVKSYHLDFILRFGFGIIRGNILSVARYGVWSFHHDDEQKYRGSPPCFWEIVRNDPVTGFVLQRLTDRLDAGIILRKGYIKTYHHSYSQNVDGVYFQSTVFPAQVCIDILNGHTDYLHQEPSDTEAPVFRSPDNIQTLRFLAVVLFSKLSLYYRSLFRKEDWNVGVVDRPIHTFIGDTDVSGVEWIPRVQKNRFAADPFGVSRKEKHFIFFEDFDYWNSKGVVACIERKEGQPFSDREVVMEQPSHLSYPCVIEDSGKVYCLPENHQAKEIALYEAKSFPNDWVKMSVLVEDFEGVDATLFRYDDYWWISCTPRYHPNHALFLWYGRTLTGAFLPHAQNPVKMDVRSSRPAGTPFIYNGSLYRPAQDNSQTYGGRIVLNKVHVLSPTTFRESPIGVIAPEPGSAYPDGLHTLSAMGEKTLVDGKRYRFVGVVFRRKVKRKWSLLLSRWS